MSREQEDFIRQRFALEPLPFRSDIKLYRPTPRTGLSAWLEEQSPAGPPPYWAYAWAGGAALALYLQTHRDRVIGKKVLDFGAGSGLLAIAAARAGAASVTALEPDPIGKLALRLNAAANAVAVTLADTIAADIDTILAGDVFYDAAIAQKTLPLLQAAAAKGATVLIGDPFRRHLPLSELSLLARFTVPDMDKSLVEAGVFALPGPNI